MDPLNFIWNGEDPSPSVEGSSGSNRRLAPPIGSVKANWDLVIDKYYGRIGIGVVVRDSKDDIVVAKSH